jgi:hypothetical protein
MKRLKSAEVNRIAKDFYWRWIAMYGARNADKLSLAVRRVFKRNPQQKMGKENQSAEATSENSGFGA